MAAGQLTTLDSLFDGSMQEIIPISELETVRSSHRSYFIVRLYNQFSCERVYPFLLYLVDRDGSAPAS